jgi:hypothetical protein
LTTAATVLAPSTARVISSIAATLCDDEFILREIPPETLLAATPVRK